MSRPALTPEQQALFDNNIKLAYYVVRRYLSQRSERIDYDDLVQEAMIGLIQAAQRYDPKLGYRFATYAVLLMRRRLQRHLHKNSSPFSVSNHPLAQPCPKYIALETVPVPERLVRAEDDPTAVHVYEWLDTLTPRLRRLAVGLYKGKSISQIARDEGISAQAHGVRVKELRRRLAANWGVQPNGKKMEVAQ